MAIVFALEPFDTAYRDAGPMLARHYDEIAENKEALGPLAPDVATYKAIEATGRLRVLVGRDEGRIVAYIAFIVTRNLHYDVIGASDDVYWVDPDYRGVPRLALRLFIEAEKIMRAEKVTISTVKAKLASDHERFFATLGYRPLERVYCKIIGKDHGC